MHGTKTTIERLQGAFDSTTELVEGTVVNYVDFTREELQIGNVFTAVETKDIPYKDEREFRLMIWKPSPTNRPLSPTEKGIRVPVDLGSVLRKIYVSPQRVAPAPTVLADLIRTKHVDCEIVSSAVVEE